MERLILTIAQAHALQRSDTPWPAQWAFMLMPEPAKPHTRMDSDRMAIGLTMMQRGCEDDQIAEQLGWKPDSSALRQLVRIYRLSLCKL